MTGAEQPVKEAQFIDDGGLVRLYAVADGNLTLWVLVRGDCRIDPANGDVTEIGGADPVVAGRHAARHGHEDGNNTARGCATAATSSPAPA